MITIENLIQHLPTDGRTVIHSEKGNIISIEQLRPDQFIATLPAFIEMAERAGYIITIPDI
ncbi:MULTISPECIES: hypothetical protein [Yersinia]|uniref:Phage-like protein n=1 Tax=Yersinia enterocolitica LC20 TaxID=1443113 RepID=A0A7U5STR4_YEREN|nr:MULTISPECIES: hypothetical protein [Yersinia]EKN4773465.1 hypothetical protein [Yersinia enterocolitica]ATX62891.1 hypothetical protein LC20_08005 [Yersinia hibernica]EKN5996362.1 hypothetical protein [Yersinia enterocolitica]EKN6210058.1 hypothetical protein [Yersinia enterocolitica]ELI7924991.1 hypothetical protein [Yersinia enterocolitica]